MTEGEILSELSKTGPVKLKDERIKESVTANNIKADSTILENCFFENDFKFQNVDFSYGVKFINCVFEKNLIISECSAARYDMEFNYNSYHLEFENTKIHTLHLDGRNNIERGVIICNKSVIKNLVINTLISKSGGFAINDSTIEDVFDIRQAKIHNDLSIRENSIINAKVRIENVENGGITLTHSTFKKDIHIWAGKTGALVFNDGAFHDDLYIKAMPIKHLSIVGTEFKKSINFTMKDADRIAVMSNIYIESAKFGKQLIVDGSDTTCEELVIDASKLLEGEIHFNSINILLAKLSGNNYNSNIVFNYSNFNKLNLDFFNNFATVSFISVKSFSENSEITIAHSNLGKTQFFNAFLNTFTKIRIFNSVLTDILVANIKWFRDECLNPEVTPSSSEYTFKKELYRQIKYALEKQGDRISSLRFKALEMNAFKNESFAKVQWYKRIFSVDRFILWLGHSNDFGQNWLKPVILAISFTFLFYILIVIGISERLTYIPNFNKESLVVTVFEMKKYLYALPQLMNPANALSKVFPEITSMTFSLSLLEYLLKIILAFFIFQIVGAFRKYMK